MTRYKNRDLIKYLLVVAAIIGIVYCWAFVYHDFILLYWGDETQQVIPFLSDMFTMIKTGTLSFWNPKIGLGATNFVHFFTLLGSPSFYLYLLVLTTRWLVYAIPIVDALRFLLIAYFAYHWIGKLTGNKQLPMWLGGIIFTFSGWAMYWMHFSYFLDGYLYLAILLCCCEDILVNQHPLRFTIIIALAAILSPYMAYMFFWLVFMYLTCRIWMTTTQWDWKTYFKKFCTILAYALLGIGLAAVIFIPCIKILLTTNRIETDFSSLFSILDKEGIFRLFTSFFSPVINDYDYNIFSSPFIKLNNKVYTVYLYSSILFIILLPQLWKMKFAGKKPLLICCLINFLFYFFPLFYFLFNGNTSVRWSFFAIVFNVLLLVKILENHQQMNKKALLIGGSLAFLLLSFFTFISFQFDLTSTINQIQLIKNMVILTFCIVATCVCFHLSQKKWVGALTIIVSIEAVFCYTSRIENGTTPIVANRTTYQEYAQQMFDTEAIDWIKQQDKSLYRIDYASNDPLAYNYPMIKDYSGFTFYISIYNHETRPLYDQRFSDNWFIGYAPSKFMLKSLLGGKYLVVNKQEPTLIPASYELVHETTTKQIYKNSISVELGYASAKTVSNKSVENLDKSVEEFVFLNAIVDDKSSNMNLDISKFETLAKQQINQGISLNKKNGYLFIDYSNTIPSSLVSVEFYREGQVVHVEERNEYGYTAVEVEEDVDDVYVYARNSNNTNEFVPVNLYWIAYEDIQKCYHDLQAEDHFEDILVTHDHIQASITIEDENKTVMTTLPYNPGWSVTVDGKKVKTKIVNSAMLGFDLSLGQHHIEFDFMPDGLVLGGGISVVSSMIFIFILVKRKKTACQITKEEV